MTRIKFHLVLLLVLVVFLGITDLRAQRKNGFDLTESEIPIELANLTNLNYVYLENNQLTGSIPAGLSNSTRLRNLYLK